MNTFEVYKKQSGYSYADLARLMGASRSYTSAILHNPGAHDNLLFLIRVGFIIGMSDQMVRDCWVALRRERQTARIIKRSRI